jgi:predicted transcriptional regulator
MEFFKNHIRKGKNSYIEKYEKAKELAEKNYSIKEIANILGISYSAAYQWIKKKKEPKKDKITLFYDFLSKNGPSPLAIIKKDFPKHSEIYNSAISRGFKIKRYKLPRIFKEYSIWYYLEGQENSLKERIKIIINKREEMKNEIAEKIFDRLRSFYEK